MATVFVSLIGLLAPLYWKTWIHLPFDHFRTFKSSTNNDQIDDDDYDISKKKKNRSKDLP